MLVQYSLWALYWLIRFKGVYLHEEFPCILTHYALVLVKKHLLTSAYSSAYARLCWTATVMEGLMSGE